MFECALFGVVKNKFEWNGTEFTRVEKVYSSCGKRAIVLLENAGIRIIFYEQPDRNKQRTAVVFKTSSVKFSGNSEDCDTFLTGIGYSLNRTSIVKGILYERNGYIIEISKLKRKEDVVDSSEEELEEEGIPECLFDNYFVKAFVHTETPLDGEKILNMALNDLNDVVKLEKPDLNLFIK